MKMLVGGAGDIKITKDGNVLNDADTAPNRLADRQVGHLP